MATQQVVNVGTQANDATGDLLRDAFTKINTNFAALFSGTFPAAQLVVGPPPSGVALTVNGFAAANALVVGTVSIATAGNVVIGSPTTGNPLSVNAAAGAGLCGNFVGSTGFAVAVAFTDGGTGTRQWQTRVGQVSVGTYDIFDNTANASRLQISTTGATTLGGTLGINGNSPPAQVTGWGTPVGNAAISNYNITDAGGANSNTNKAVAQIIATLKALGLFGT